MPQRVFVIILYRQIQAKALAQRIHRAGQQTVPYPQQPLLLPFEQHPGTETISLDAVAFGLIAQQLQPRLFHQSIADSKQPPQLGGGHLFAAAVGRLLHHLAEINLQPTRQRQPMVLFQQPGSAAFARLAVNPDHRLIAAADVRRIER
ncbi:hypothetical protein D3C72_1506540 [compost metagenome]